MRLQENTNYCIVRRVLKEDSGERRTSMKVWTWKQHGSTRAGKDEIYIVMIQSEWGQEILTVKSAFQMQQSDTPMTPQRGKKA